jgi:hypothetical protein
MAKSFSELKNHILLATNVRDTYTRDLRVANRHEHGKQEQGKEQSFHLDVRCNTIRIDLCETQALDECVDLIVPFPFLPLPQRELIRSG